MRIDDMTIEQKLTAIEWYQSSWRVHEFTCRNGHGKLIGERIGINEAILACKNCHYIERVPALLYAAYFLHKEVIKS